MREIIDFIKQVPPREWLKAGIQVTLLFLFFILLTFLFGILELGVL